MKINEKSIRGMFLYTEDAVYERGDFIILGDSIYVCSPKQGDIISGENHSPDKDYENYYLYLGGEKATWEDFKNQFDSVTETTSSDKLITSTGLSQILNKISFGINSVGIIKESTQLPKNNKLNSLLINSGYSGNSENDIIDYLLLSENIPEFNNITVRVSRTLFNDLLPNIDNLNLDELDRNSVILRQYTYEEEAEYTETDSENKIRVQEVIDHINGICLYRYTRFGKDTAYISGNESKIGVMSYWKLSCPNLNYMNQLNSVLKYIQDNKKVNTKSSMFRFKDITDLVVLNNTFSASNIKKSIYTIDTTVKDSLKVTTVTISIKDLNNRYTNYSMTVNLNNSIDYCFPNGIILRRKGNSIELEYDSSISSVEIDNIYIRSFN